MRMRVKPCEKCGGFKIDEPLLNGEHLAVQKAPNEYEYLKICKCGRGAAREGKGE